jgi:hypothetical protein
MPGERIEKPRHAAPLDGASALGLSLVHRTIPAARHPPRRVNSGFEEVPGCRADCAAGRGSGRLTVAREGNPLPSRERIGEGLLCRSVVHDASPFSLAPAFMPGNESPTLAPAPFDGASIPGLKPYTLSQFLARTPPAAAGELWVNFSGDGSTRTEVSAEAGTLIFADWH